MQSARYGQCKHDKASSQSELNAQAYLTTLRMETEQR